MSRKKPVRAPRQFTSLRWVPWLIGMAAVAAIAALAILVSGGQRPAAPIEVSGAPSLKVNQEKVDLGDVRLGQTVSAEFEVVNAGDRPLRFTAAPYIEVVEGC